MIPPAPRPLSRVIVELGQTAGARVSLQELTEALSDRSFAALIILFAAPNLLPLPPGSSTFFGIPLILIASQLLLVVALVGLTDVIFAVDSIPAIFAITTDPFIVYTSNIFAILGLRALYFALAAMIHRFVYLRHALAAVLVFIGGKIFVADMLGLAKVPPAVSLAVTLAIIAAGIVASLWSTRRPADTSQERA